jgi:hypothetical protein
MHDWLWDAYKPYMQVPQLDKGHWLVLFCGVVIGTIRPDNRNPKFFVGHLTGYELNTCSNTRVVKYIARKIVEHHFDQMATNHETRLERHINWLQNQLGKRTTWEDIKLPGDLPRK